VLVLLVGYFVRREFKRFDSKLTEACEGNKTKVEQQSFEKFKGIIFYQLHEHDHRIECDVDNCKPKTTGVIIHERRTT
jgi:hypothetical protein